MNDSSRKGRKTEFNNGGYFSDRYRFHWSLSPKGTLVFLEGFMDEHVSLHFVLPIERCLTEGAFVWLFT